MFAGFLFAVDFSPAAGFSVVDFLTAVDSYFGAAVYCQAVLQLAVLQAVLLLEA